METKIRHMRIPEELSSKIEAYRDKNDLPTFTSAALSIFREFFNMEEEKRVHRVSKRGSVD